VRGRRRDPDARRRYDKGDGGGGADALKCLILLRAIHGKAFLSTNDEPMLAAPLGRAL
jgi:hypothetical protein